MKKLFIASFLMFLLGSFLFAESYTVKAIRGANGNNGFAKVKQAGQAVAITIGQELTDEDQVVLIKGNYIELDNGYFIYESGLVKDTVTNKRRLQKIKRITTSTIAPATEGTKKGVVTAASRASDTKEDFEWDEGE